MPGIADPSFPIPFVEEFRRFSLDPSNPKLSPKQKEDLLVRPPSSGRHVGAGR